MQTNDTPHTGVSSSTSEKQDTPLQAPFSGGGKDHSVRELIQGYWDFVALNQESTTTGIASLNAVLGGGFEPKRLVAIVGSSGSGKTTLANQIATHAANVGRPVFYAISDDNPLALFAKTIARAGNIPYATAYKGWDHEKSRIKAALTDYSGTRSVDLLHYLDTSRGVSLETIKEKAKEHFTHYAKSRKAGSGLLVIDSLQSLARAQRTLSETWLDLQDVMIQYTERLQQIARELDCSVVVLVSQKRATADQIYSENAPLALNTETGDIEYLADVIIGIGEDRDIRRKQENAHSKPWLLWIYKNHQGEDHKKVLLDWHPDRQMFTEAR